MNSIEIEELVRVLEDIRSSKYPDIPAELIEKIVYAQFVKQDDRAQARKETKNLVDDFMKTIVDA